jgi:predicted phage terminase large subunit-like protein
VLNNPEWYEVRAWSRELAKSTYTMMQILYLILTKKKRYVLMISSSADNAERLLIPYKSNLELNQRIIHDYGKQEKAGFWSSKEFSTSSGASFRALGKGQSPRGTRNEEIRPDVVLFDDIDTDEECRNPDGITNSWKWIQEAAIGTRSISNPLLIIFCGNIIASYSCITCAIEYADHVDVINIRDKNGKSTWPAKNTEENIDRVLSKISYAAQQKEYFNNPINEGSVFKNLAFKKLPKLEEYKFLVCYTDPSFKSSQKSDYKATVLVGAWRGERHVIKAYCQQTTTSKMVEWLYKIKNYVSDKTPLYLYIEKNTNDEEIARVLYEASKSHNNNILPVVFDDRVKGDKFTRIESSLEPLDRNGTLYFNEDEKDTPDMKTVIDQFKAFSAKSRAHDDAPDAVEGAVFYVNNKEEILDLGSIELIKRPRNQKRY